MFPIAVFSTSLSDRSSADKIDNWLCDKLLGSLFSVGLLLICSTFSSGWWQERRPQMFAVLPQYVRDCMRFWSLLAPPIGHPIGSSASSQPSLLVFMPPPCRRQPVFWGYSSAWCTSIHAVLVNARKLRSKPLTISNDLKWFEHNIPEYFEGCGWIG